MWLRVKASGLLKVRCRTPGVSVAPARSVAPPVREPLQPSPSAPMKARKIQTSFQRPVFRHGYFSYALKHSSCPPHLFGDTRESHIGLTIAFCASSLCAPQHRTASNTALYRGATSSNAQKLHGKSPCFQVSKWTRSLANMTMKRNRFSILNNACQGKG